MKQKFTKSMLLSAIADAVGLVILLVIGWGCLVMLAALMGVPLE